MIRFDSENYVQNLPDCYEKQADSNNDKLLRVEQYPVGELKADSRDVFNILDIYTATGKTLDLYGEMVGQARGMANDEQYLYMVLSKMMRNLSTGDYLSVSRAIYQTFDCDPAQVLIVENPEPGTVDLITLPLAAIIQADLTINQTISIIRRLMPVGINVKSFLFEGTFEFSETESDMAVDGDTKGFCDVEDGTLGGYFGVVYGMDEEIPLPID